MSGLKEFYDGYKFEVQLLAIFGIALAASCGFLGWYVNEASKPKPLINVESAEGFVENICDFEGKQLVTNGYLRFDPTGQEQLTGGHQYPSNLNLYEKPLLGSERVLVYSNLYNGGKINKSDFLDFTPVEIRGRVYRFFIYNTDNCYLYPMKIDLLSSKK